MSKLRIRINNKDILKTLPNGFCPGIAHRRVRFGIADDMELMELYPDGTTDEFIGFMDPLKDGVYMFVIDRCCTTGMRVGTIQVLDANNPKDLALYRKALEQDYGFASDDYTIINK